MNEAEVVDHQAPVTGRDALDRETAAELLDWRPEGGVVSVYVNVHPGERGGRWRIELRDDLERVLGLAGNGEEEAQLALKATAKRIEESMTARSREPAARGIVGYVQATRAGGEERWFTTQLAPRRTEAHFGARATLAPLLALLEDGSPTGVAVVSGECIRLFDWRLGRLEQLHDWELEVFSLDWREQKAAGPRDTAAPSGVSSSGHDQYEQRLESSRERFADEAGAMAGSDAGEHGWEQVLVFGDQRAVGPFTHGFAEACAIHHVESSDLVAQPTHLIAERVDRVLPSINRERQLALVERIKDAAFGSARASLGRQETKQSLEEGRVERLVYDARLDGIEVEMMIEMAASTGAAVVPVEGAAAACLSDQEGVAALLRY